MNENLYMNVKNESLVLSDEEMIEKDKKKADKFKEQLIRRLSNLRKKVYPKQQDAFSAKIGVPYNRYAKYESRSLLQTHLIPKAAKLLNVSVDYLLTGKEVPSKLDIDLLVMCVEYADEYNESAAWKARYIALMYDMYIGKPKPTEIEPDGILKIMNHFLN